MMHIGNFLPTEFEDYQSGIYNVQFKSGSRNSKVLVPVIRTKKGGYRCYSQKIDPCEESASTTSSCSPKYALTFIAKKQAQSEWIWDWSFVHTVLHTHTYVRMGVYKCTYIHRLRTYIQYIHAVDKYIITIHTVYSRHRGNQVILEPSCSSEID